jgi:hypothetical protein
MPAPQLHLTFGSLVKDHDGVPARMRRACAAEPVYTRLGAIFHDLPYYGNMLIEAIRYGLESPALDEPWAYRMHSVRPGRFVASYLRAAAVTPGLTPDERLALAGGLLSHCALDLTLHPLVNYCARRDTSLHGGHESVNHRLTEKYHALFFHLHRLGYDPIGTPELVRATRITKAPALVRARVEAPLAAFARDAFAGAYGGAPSVETWSGWVRSFRHFGLLVGTPMAARNSHKKQQDPTLRARYFENDVFSFWSFYAASERRLTELCRLGFDYVEAGDFSRAAEDAFVAAARIDDLAEPGEDAATALPPLPRLTVRCTPGITAPPGHLPWRRRERRRVLESDVRRSRSAPSAGVART